MKSKRLPFDRNSHDWQHAGAPPQKVPAGTIVMYAGATAPRGWLLCNGTAVKRGTYTLLYQVIGTTYGTGDGSTTFNLPDLRDRHPVGKGTDISALGQTTPAGQKHASGGAHNHDAHGNNNNTTTGGAATRLTGNGLADGNTHNSDGGHQHDNHNYATGAVPPYLGLNFIIKY